MKANAKKVFYVILLIVIILSLIGCPATEPSKVDLVDGSYFKQHIVENIMRDYEVNFSTNSLPEVILSYYTNDNFCKIAKFILDGYDPDKKVGYIFVTTDENINWEKLRKEGNNEAPDLKDIAIIQNEALNYKFPILFIWNPNYSESADCTWLVKQIENMFNSKAMIQWKKDHFDAVKESVLSSPSPIS